VFLRSIKSFPNNRRAIWIKKSQIIEQCIKSDYPHIQQTLLTVRNLTTMVVNFGQHIIQVCLFLSFLYPYKFSCSLYEVKLTNPLSQKKYSYY
jgi:hypothetical protein